MYLRILKKDLRHKRTMNVIILVFIIFASTFIAGSVSNMASIVTAMDRYMKKAEVPDYWVVLGIDQDRERFEEFARENRYKYKMQELLLADAKDIGIDGEALDYSNTTYFSTVGDATKIFDQNNREITRVEDGKIYLSRQLANSVNNHLEIGSRITVSIQGRKKTFTLAGFTKDVMFGSSMAGVTRFVISDRDYEEFAQEGCTLCYSVCVYTDDGRFLDQFNDLSLNTVFQVDRDGIKQMYIMDMLIAGVLLIVSVCLILISMLILRFTIHFTMSEEFREIGVMKAIGISNTKIRGLYLVKYLAISTVGVLVGLILSFPLSNAMLGNLRQNIIMLGDRFLWLPVLCALAVAVVVVGFCYFCTRGIKSFSPIDAIRNGESGERYRRKGVISLSRWRFSVVSFLACNDILSGIRRFVVMLLIFTLGILLVIIPVNTINTLQSDQLITWFNMTECDHIINEEGFVHATSNQRELVQRELDEIKAKLGTEGMKADVFVEVMFRMHISHNQKKTSSLAFQGVGDVAASQYAYLEGTAPQRKGEVAISHIIAKKLDAAIGDTVEITNGEQVEKYIVTAINQSMNNMGEGIRFYQEEPLDYRYMTGSFGKQIRYTDHPDRQELVRRKKVLKKLFSGSRIFTAGEYINEMIGDSAGQLQGTKKLVLGMILCVNIFLTVLMVNSFLTREKGEIAMLKAIGFCNASVVVWQTLRIVFVLLLSIFLGALLGTPVSEISAGKVFQMMGAFSIRFEIVPWEVYVMYPAIMLVVTMAAGLLASLKACNIMANEIRSVE